MNYTNRIKELSVNFSYYPFIDLLKEIDREIINGNISRLDPEFIYYFKQITGMVNDNYLVDGKPGTLGHMLVENALLKKEKLTPTLTLCFLLEQKQSLGLDDVCNDINFVHLNGGNYNMMVEHYSDIDYAKMNINWQYYENLKSDTDEYNYEIMWSTLHELTHVYQLTRTEDAENVFDKIVYYDYKTDSILLKYGGSNTNIYFHQALLSEFMADEQAHVFMLDLIEKHPEYFNEELISKKEKFYQNRKNGVYGNFGDNPREAFLLLISGIKQTEEDTKGNPEYEFLTPMISEVEEIMVKSEPLVKELEAKGISEKGTDIYYSVYLKKYYRYDGKDFVLVSEQQESLTLEDEGIKLVRKKTEVANEGKINLMMLLIPVSLLLIILTIIMLINI